MTTTIYSDFIDNNFSFDFDFDFELGIITHFDFLGYLIQLGAISIYVLLSKFLGPGNVDILIKQDPIQEQKQEQKKDGPIIIPIESGSTGLPG
jgi:hypothetical protein